MNSVNVLHKLSIRGVIFLLLLAVSTQFSISQDYKFSLQQRRSYDKIEVEVWAKALTSNPDKLGYASLVLQYNTEYLRPAISQSLDKTDSISAIIDQVNPVDEIISQFSSINAYNSSNSRNYGSGKYSLELTLSEMGNGGIELSSQGRGSFLGRLSFDIINSPSENDTTGIRWNIDNMPGDIRVFAADSSDIEGSITFVEPGSFDVIGITILSPSRFGQVIDRDHNYASLLGDYAEGGYPIYFERSVDPEVFPFESTDLAYQIDYSLNDGAYWSEIGRIATVASTNLFGNESQYRTGEIFNPSTSNSYVVTTYKNEKLTDNTIREPLRVIWIKNPNYTLRSEQARIKITQLKGSGNTPLIERKKNSIVDISDNRLVLGRLFFVQLNGEEQYLKTKENINNSTQLTIEAWVNLNEYNAIGNNPGIIVSSGGKDATPTLGSTEGAWMLYLKDGKHPAFRVRERQGRGKGGYIASLVAFDTLMVKSDEEPLIDEHSTNWVHLAATVDNNEVSLYINGELAAKKINRTATDIRMLTTKHPIWIGVNANVEPMEYLHAGIKGVRIWRTALSSDQIRRRVAGIPTPTEIPTHDDILKGLDSYYSFEGTIIDLANDSTYQKAYQVVEFVDQQTNINVKYRPDRPHLTITSPVSGSGVKNQQEDIHTIRWVSYGLGDITEELTNDVVIEYSTDNGENWLYTKSPEGTTLGSEQLVDVEVGYTNWEPYNNNDISGDLRSLDPYAKNVILRIRGTQEKNQDDLNNTTNPFYVAPYFSLKRGTESIIEIPSDQGMNIVGNNIFFETWIRPYHLPIDTGDYMPIMTKMDTATKEIHYALRLLRTGQLQFLITDDMGIERKANSDINLPIVRPNSINIDTAWTHIGVFLNTNNGSGQSEIRFYIDGTAQRLDTIAHQLGENLIIPSVNEFPTYVGYVFGQDTIINWKEQVYDPISGDPLMDDDGNPVLETKYDTLFINAKSFVGEMREMRYWNGIPNNSDFNGNEPTELTTFIQGAMTVKGNELDPTKNMNLYAALSMNGGSYIVNGYNRALGSSINTAVTARCWEELFVYEPVMPYAKLVEPIFKQVVPNTDTTLRVRWVGFEYNGIDFSGGKASLNPSIEFSCDGGGGSDVQPYQYVGSVFWSGNDVNSLSFPNNDDFVFVTGNKNIYYAGSLNVSMADPDENNDENTNDQGPLSASLTSARLRLTAFYTVNDNTLSFQTESPLFTITPASNFTIRALLEGHHNGYIPTMKMRDLGTTFDEGGLKISLFKDNSGGIGEYAGTSESFNGYDELDPKNRNIGTNRFANVHFVFTDLNDGNYWVLVEHINHLPIMSRFAAPFKYIGDDRTTWKIESGWDFESWNGIDNNVLTDVNNDPWLANSYTAKGNAISTIINPSSSSTGLIFNDGLAGTMLDPMPAMVGGDCYRDGEINAADRITVRKDEGTGLKRSDITGDGYVNADDRTIVDRNFGMISSVYPDDYNMPSTIKLPSTDYISDLDIQMSEMFVNNYERLETKAGYTAPRIKKSDKLQSAYSFKVSADMVMEGNYVDLLVYIEGTGATFNLANATFAVGYNPDAIKFADMVLEEEVIFDGYRGITEDSVDNLGYGAIGYAPSVNALDPITGVHSIEVSFDAAYIGDGSRIHKFPGKEVPKTKTYLGTLRFKIVDKKGALNFKWYETCSVHSVNNGILTPYGEFEEIENKRLYEFVLTQPNGGETYSENRNYFAKWQTDGNDLVNIELSVNEGNTWKQLNTEPVQISAGQFEWTAPPVHSEKCLMRAIAISDFSILDESDAVFAIIGNFAQITKPSISTTLHGGETSDIQWKAAGYDNLRFDFTADLGQTWTIVAESVGSELGTVNWSVPNITTKEARIRMIDLETNQEIAISGTFRIVSGSIFFRSPKAGEVICHDKDYRVRWITQDVDLFDLQITKDGGLNWYFTDKNINASLKNLNWDAPSFISKDCYIRAVYPSDASMEFGRSEQFELSNCSIVEDLPDGYSIGESFPNPANTTTSLNIEFENGENVSIIVYNENGGVIKEIPAKFYANGSGMIEINVADIPVGSYFIYVKSDNIEALRKLIINR